MQRDCPIELIAHLVYILSLFNQELEALAPLTPCSNMYHVKVPGLLLASLEVPGVGPDALEQLQVVRVDHLVEAVHLCVVTLGQIRTMLNQQVQRVEVASARCMVRWGPTIVANHIDRTRGFRLEHIVQHPYIILTRSQMHSRDPILPRLEYLRPTGH